MSDPALSMRLQSAATAGFVTAFCLGVAAVLLGGRSTADRLLLGTPGSLFVLGAALLVTVGAVVAVLRRATSPTWRRSILLVGAALLVALIVMAVDCIVTATLPYLIIGLLLAGGALGLGSLLGRLSATHRHQETGWHH